MATTTCYVSSGSEDWDDSSSTSTTMVARNTSALGIQYAYADIDTSSIPAGSTINSATLNYFHASYSKDPSESYLRRFSSYDGSSWNLFYTDTTTPPTRGGWRTAPLNSTAMDAILTGVLKIRFDVGSITYPIGKTWSIRTYEYPSSPTYRAYVEIDYTEPVADKAMNPKRRVIVIA